LPFGKPGQLIPGLQYGLSLMKSGERALIFMPSALAFGEDGSNTGIIPPRTPIYFDVNVIEVKKID
jgi:peptidylprolyl isomerase